ncbi:MAG: hypothetical protein IJC91_00165, partial [Oscillospiraceae bacterium]|nr:hypothetical protein [Oscillospiraceae bacterium]
IGVTDIFSLKIFLCSAVSDYVYGIVFHGSSKKSVVILLKSYIENRWIACYNLLYAEYNLCLRYNCGKEILINFVSFEKRKAYEPERCRRRTWSLAGAFVSL